MTDIVERLRAMQHEFYVALEVRALTDAGHETLCAAANEIERLRAEVAAAEAAARREGIETAAKWHEAKAAWWNCGAESARLEPNLSEEEIAARVDEFRANAAEHENSAAAIRALLENGQ